MNNIVMYTIGIMAKIMGGEEQVNSTEIVITTMRYGILIVLFIVSMYLLEFMNLQLIMFIILLVIFVLGSLFLIKDITSISKLSGIINTSKPMSLTTDNSMFLYLFSLAISIGCILKIISLTFFIVVLDYGRKELEKNNNKQLSSFNMNILKNYNKYFLLSTIMIICLSTLIFISYSSETTRQVVKNIMGILLSLGIMGLTGFEMYFSVMFLKIRQKKDIVYEITKSGLQIQ